MGTKRSRGIQKSKDVGKNLGIVIVAFGNEIVLPELLRRLALEKKPGDEIVIIDNHAEHRCADIADDSDVVDVVIRSDNIGFAAGCNRAVEALSDQVGLVLLLNPDVMPEPEAITKLRKGTRHKWGAWMGLLALPDGTINSAGNVVHMSGLSWCDLYGQPVQAAQDRKSVDIVSGACLMITREAWDALGGMAEEYFMYYEDTDISVSLRQQGFELGIMPEAIFIHDYAYEKGQQKWFHLERNRYMYIFRQWPVGLIIVLLPFLLVVEIGLWAVSIVQGRFGTRLRAVVSFIKLIPRLLRSRQATSAYRSSAAQFIEYLQPQLDSPLLGSIGQRRWVTQPMLYYYRMAQFILAKL